MKDGFSFVKKLPEVVADKQPRVRDVIKKILQQTEICALFIQNYVQRKKFLG
jgi:hypothetical protein